MNVFKVGNAKNRIQTRGARKGISAFKQFISGKPEGKGGILKKFNKDKGALGILHADYLSSHPHIIRQHSRNIAQGQKSEISLRHRGVQNNF